MSRQFLLNKAFDWDIAYIFRGLVHNHHGGEPTGMALEQYLRALYPNLQADRETPSGMGF